MLIIKLIIKKLLDTDDKAYWAVDKFVLFKDGCMLTADEGGRIQSIQIIREELDEYKDSY